MEPLRWTVSCYVNCNTTDLLQSTLFFLTFFCALTSYGWNTSALVLTLLHESLHTALRQQDVLLVNWEYLPLRTEDIRPTKYRKFTNWAQENQINAACLCIPNNNARQRCCQFLKGEQRERLLASNAHLKHGNAETRIGPTNTSQLGSSGNTVAAITATHDHWSGLSTELNCYILFHNHG